MTYKEAVEYLYNARPPFHLVGAAAYKPGLENTLRLMAHVGNPHEKLRAIHVAGTNGKGSTSHLIAAVLQAAGYKVGLYTSPHLVSLTERIRINGVPIPESEVAQFVETNQAFLDEAQPSFFETMTAMAFAYFVAQEVDVAVVEVGLGGRLDSTNVLTPVLSVITNIGLDHTEFLGNTLAKIAREKAGIIKPGVPCVIGETHPQTMNVFLDRARECGILGEGPETTDCRIWFADQCGYLRKRRLREAPECELKGLYQEKNLQTAFVALQVLRNYGITGLRDYEITKEAIREGFSHVCRLTGLRGRWEVIKEHPYVVCDTGHNAHGWTYLSKQIATTPCDKRHIVFSMLEDKDVNAVMKMLPKNATYYLSQVECQRAMSIEKLAALADEYHLPHKEYNSIWEAYTEAIKAASHNDMVFVGGSSYVVAEFLTKLAQ